MAIIKTLITGFILATSLCSALATSAESAVEEIHSLDARAPTRGHDKIVGFDESVPSGLVGDLYKKHKPFLKVEHGCVPFPAVDKDGYVSEGLKETGVHNENCSKSTGQVYSRSLTFNGRFAIMYAWYMPKDADAHRHDWESVVVWLNGRKEDAKIVGISYSAHGKYKKMKYNSSNKKYWDSNHPKVSYGVDLTSHAVTSTTEKGVSQPLVDYSQLTEKAQNALDTHIFERAKVPIATKNFIDELRKATL